MVLVGSRAGLVVVDVFLDQVELLVFADSGAQLPLEGNPEFRFLSVGT